MTKIANANAETPPETKPEACKTPSAALPETGGPKGPEPTRYGDWERKGKCVDF